MRLTTTLLLRLEGVALFLAALIGYAATDAGWLLFFLLILAPDLSMAGYWAGPRIGAAIYNAAHTTIGPLILLMAALLTGADAIHLAAVWLAHIGIDRALGYGLKRPSGFTDTHLGRIGRDGADQSSIRSPG